MPACTGMKADMTAWHPGNLQTPLPDRVDGPEAP